MAYAFPDQRCREKKIMKRKTPVSCSLGMDSLMINNILHQLGRKKGKNILGEHPLTVVTISNYCIPIEKLAYPGNRTE